jgi:hypothetical protein
MVSKRVHVTVISLALLEIKLCCILTFQRKDLYSEPVVAEYKASETETATERKDRITDELSDCYLAFPGDQDFDAKYKQLATGDYTIQLKDNSEFYKRRVMKMPVHYVASVLERLMVIFPPTSTSSSTQPIATAKDDAHVSV